MRRTLLAFFYSCRFLAGSAGSEDKGFVQDVETSTIELGRRGAQIRSNIEHERQTAPAARPRIPQVEIADPWSDDAKRRYLGWTGAPSKFDEFGNMIWYDSPFPFMAFLPQWVDPFPEAKAREIADRCKRSFPGWWDRIGCVSHGVHGFFLGFKFAGWRSFCRSHAVAFDNTFAALGLNRAISKTIDGSGGPEEKHVVNQIVVTAMEGVTYSYVMDSGNEPGKLFPANDNAVRFHDRDRDGKTDSFELPAISENPRYTFKPAP